MNYNYQKVLPEDVFVSIHPKKVAGRSKDGYRVDKFVCPNKLSGVEFMDIFAHAVWSNPLAEVSYYASKMNLADKDFACVVKAMSGLYVIEWRDRFVNFAAHELLEHSELSISEVASKLGFSSVRVFSHYFLRHNKKRPLLWRYNKRGFNAGKNDILEWKLSKAEKAKDGE